MFDNHEPPPDRWDRVIRFALGFIVGFPLGYFLITEVGPLRAEVAGFIIPICLVCGVVFGLLAAWRGDRVWKWIRDSGWFWPPSSRG